MSKITAAITAVGKYLPDYVLTNKELETLVETNDDWITTRTGIKERRILKEPNQGTSFMAIRAAQNLLRKSKTNPEDIDMVIVATATPDLPVASTAVYTATEIGATNAFAYDLQAACSSFLYGMSTAASYIESGRYKKVLLIGADKMSSIIDYSDRATCIIFGDGAGAALFEPNSDGLGLQDEYLRSDGAGREFLKIEAGGSILPPSESTLKNGQHFVHQEGKTVFKFAVSNMADVAEKMLLRNNLSHDEINWLVPHQANKRIIEATAKRVNLDSSKVMMKIHK
jgi:3-oxoacyl-[acyl-carrier-protein] synthase-3